MDIVKRLRGDYGVPVPFTTTPICHEAADEIERLRHAIIKIRTITNVDWVEDMDKHDTDINEIIKKALGG